jgi:hypothetical protein
MALLQNFSVSRANDEVLTVTLESDLTSGSLASATVRWTVYGMSYGMPMPSPELISKSSLSGGGIVILESPPLTFVINLKKIDTAGFDLGNYYHEALIIDDVGNHSTVMYGAMAITLSLEGE